MNVLLINGSPHKNGCTNAALAEVAKTLNEAGIETTIFHIGAAPVGGCVSCGGCGRAGKCVFGGPVADVLPLVEKADGIVFGAPVHYATAAASMLGFMHGQRCGKAAGGVQLYRGQCASAGGALREANAFHSWYGR